jgi:hypothetical protein
MFFQNTIKNRGKYQSQLKNSVAEYHSFVVSGRIGWPELCTSQQSRIAF